MCERKYSLAVSRLMASRCCELETSSVSTDGWHLRLVFLNCKLNSNAVVSKGIYICVCVYIYIYIFFFVYIST